MSAPVQKLEMEFGTAGAMYVFMAFSLLFLRFARVVDGGSVLIVRLGRSGIFWRDGAMRKKEDR